MKSAESKTGNIRPFPLRFPSWRQPDELAFLPAALEIIESPASPLARLVSGTIILFFTVAIVWASLGKVDIIATASGRIIPTGKTKTIQPFETGVVRAIHVADGQVVAAGDVLVELDSTANSADEKRLGRNLTQDRLDVARLRALIAADTDVFAPPDDADPQLVTTARRQMEAQAAEQEAKLAALDRQIAQKEAEGREAEATIAKVAATLPLVQSQRDIREALLRNEFGSKLTYLQSQQQVVELEHELLVQQQKREQTQQAVSAIQRQRAQAAAEFRKSLLVDLAKAQVGANEHGEEEVKAAQKRAWQTLKAPVEGTVQQLMVHTVGGVVQPGQQLMVIVPKDAGLEIEASLANKDMGFVRPGQEAEVKVETFNFTRYGLLRGTVANVSRDVVAADLGTPDGQKSNAASADAAKDDQERQARQPSYVAHIGLGETRIATEEGWRQLEPGMAVTVEIKTGRRRVIGYLLSPLLRYSHDALTER